MRSKQATIAELFQRKRNERSRGSQVAAEGEGRSAPRVRTEPEDASFLHPMEKALSLTKHGDENATAESPQMARHSGADELGSDDELGWKYLEGSDSEVEDLEFEPERVEEDYEQNAAHEYFEPVSKCSGVEETTLVRLASGETKMVRDLVEGDYLLDRRGTPKRVTRVTFVTGEGYEITRNTTSRNFDIHARQRVIVGAQQLLEVSVEQTSMLPHALMEKDTEGKMSIAYRELVEETVVDTDSRRRVLKARETSTAVSYSTVPKPRVSVASKEEAERQVRANAYEKVPKHNGAPAPYVRWYPEARDMVVYRSSGPGTSRSDSGGDRDRIAANIAALSLGIRVRYNLQIPAGVVTQGLAASPERQEFERAASRLSPTQLETFWYLAGAWVGDGYMRAPAIAVDSIDKESMERFRDDAASLGLYCDIEYNYIPEDELALKWNQVNKKGVCIHLSSPAGISDEDRARFDRLLEFTFDRARKAKEWKRDWDEQQRRRKERGETLLQRGPNPFYRGAAIIILFDGYVQDLRVVTSANWLWQLFLKARIKGSTIKDGKQISIKTGPQWLITSPVEWREAFLAGLTESDGSKSSQHKVYTIATVYQELCDLVVAVARSLGITASADCRQLQKPGKKSQLVYLIRLTGGEALCRTMRRVASPRKKPDDRWAVVSDWELEPGLIRYAVTPLHNEFRFGRVELDGHEFTLGDGLVSLDADAQGHFTEMGWRSSPDKPEQTEGEEACIACHTTGIAKFRPSWNFREGRLCNACGKRFAKVNAYCTVCKFIPGTPKWKSLQALAKPGSDGKLVYPCPTCSKGTSEQFTIVQTEQDEAHECYSCQTTEAERWFASWAPKEGVLCPGCFKRFECFKEYCKTCRLVPHLEDHAKLVPDSHGCKTFPCRRCATTITVRVEGCFLCGNCNPKKMRRYPGIDQKVCQKCLRRLQKVGVYCKTCRHVPLEKELSDDPQFAAASECQKCRSSKS